MSTEEAGNLLSGKEDERLPDELGTRTRRAKLTRRVTAQAEADKPVVEQATVAKTEDKQQSEDFYFDALLRFGIQI